MTARSKATVVLAALAFATLAGWGARELLTAAIDPVLKAVGS